MTLDDDARRRMATTGETFPAALLAVLALPGRYDFSWVHAWLADAPMTEDAETAARLRTHPPKDQALMVAFPPGCVVRPRVGDVRGPLIVCGWSDEGWTDRRMISVIGEPGSKMRIKVRAEELEVVAFWRGWTHERVRSVLGPDTTSHLPNVVSEDLRVADAEALEVQADKAEERGNAAEARLWARKAGDEFAKAAALLVAASDTAGDITEADQLTALDLVRRAERCYRRGMNWGKAKLIRLRVAEIEEMIAEQRRNGSRTS